ncbi:MAG: L-threonylcarbamoyladenylate synthase [Lachnospiraceae bacterium]|nr:L-threonylcarbamoyladenylate synthase [Lachnospiraceae bacterium]
MKTELIEIQSKDLRTAAGREILDRAAKLLQDGEVVAFPTETVYGLGADGMHASASAKIYAAKGRPSDNPLILHIAKFEQLSGIVSEISENARKLMEAFWPGPMTIILAKHPSVPLETTGGLSTVAVRMPSHPVARELILRSGLPIAAPSANRSGRPSPTTAAHVMEDMEGRIPLILDGGKVGIGIESTIIDMTGEKPVILRPGYITPAMIEEVVSGVSIDPAILGGPMAAELKPKAPGMKYRHYAPAGDMFLVEGESGQVIKKINALVKEKQSEGYKTGIIGTTENINQYCADIIRDLGSRIEPVKIAANLYGTLREMDQLGVQVIYGESFEEGEFYGAIRNRILKAAGYQIIKV